MPRAKGPKKVRIPGTNKWVPEGSADHEAIVNGFYDDPAPAPDDFTDRIQRFDPGKTFDFSPTGPGPLTVGEGLVLSPAIAAADEFDESGWEAESDLGPRPEPVAPPPVEEGIPHYYHAWLPNLRVKRGRRDAIRYTNGKVQPRTREQEARVRKNLSKYVPGGNPDRWMGDTPGITKEMRCPECKQSFRNFNVWEDHGQHTGHFKV